MKISIPYELAAYLVAQRKQVNKYETNQLIRAVGTWLLLKHETSSGIISSWTLQKKHLLQLCKCNENTFRHRLRVLSDIGFLQVKRSVIHLSSWKTIETILGIDCRDRMPVQYNINDKQQIYQWIIAAEIEDNKRRQDYMILAKMDKNIELKSELIALALSMGADRARITDDDYLLSWLRTIYISSFHRSSDIHRLMNVIRPDNNRSVKAIRRAWCARSTQTVSYWKHSLSSAGIISVQKMQVESVDRSRNKYCTVLWLKKQQQTLLVMPDIIEILKPWTLSAQIPAAA